MWPDTRYLAAYPAISTELTVLTNGKNGLMPNYDGMLRLYKHITWKSQTFLHVTLGR